MRMASSEILLEVKNLKQYFRTSRTYTVKAVDDISFNIFRGETYGLVGESGSGKSTTGRAIIRLYDPTGGSIRFRGHEIAGNLTKDEKADLRNNMQMIFQDPMSCLNARKKVIDIVGEGLDAHHAYSSKAERKEKIRENYLPCNIVNKRVKRDELLLQTEGIAVAKVRHRDRKKIGR